MVTGLGPELEQIVEQTSVRFDVSGSYAIAVALADYWGVKAQPRFDDPKRRRNGR